MKDDPIRARYLMSPYNMREAQRQAQIRDAVSGICVIAVALIIIFGSLIYFQK
jgi:hypothetical protein